MRTKILVLTSLMMASLFLLGAGPVITDSQTGDRLQTVGPEELPDFVLKTSQSVQQAYRYAEKNIDVLKYIPCFCGCKNIGHRSNENCYIKERHPDGLITFTSHALG